MTLNVHQKLILIQEVSRISKSIDRISNAFSCTPWHWSEEDQDCLSNLGKVKLALLNVSSTLAGSVRKEDPSLVHHTQEAFDKAIESEPEFANRLDHGSSGK